MSKVTLLLLFAATAVPAFAYVDPNTGGLIAQIAFPLMVVLAAAWAWVRRRMNRIKEWVAQQFRRDDHDAPIA